MKIFVFVTKTYLYNFDPLKPNFYIVKLGFTGVYIIILVSAKKNRDYRTACLTVFHRVEEQNRKEQKIKVQEICTATGTLRRSPIQALTRLTLLNFIERTRTVYFDLILTYI